MIAYLKKMHQTVPANEYCDDFIPPDHQEPATTLPTEQDQTEQNVAANAEIFESYFAMYI